MTNRTLAELTAEVREINISKGWRPAGGSGENTLGDYVALLHSELSETLEAYRDHRLADATEQRHGISLHGLGRSDPAAPLPKPEGVGSELADVFIRLVDVADVFGYPVFDMDMAIGDVSGLDDLVGGGVSSFGDWITWLHSWVTDLWPNGMADGLSLTLRALVTTCRRFGINLDAEVERKIAYNRTRPFQHGGRTLAGPVSPKREQGFLFGNDAHGGLDTGETGVRAIDSCTWPLTQCTGHAPARIAGLRERESHNHYGASECAYEAMGQPDGLDCPGRGWTFRPYPCGRDDDHEPHPIGRSPVQHSADSATAKPVRPAAVLDVLKAAMPTDPRDWWTGDEVDSFIDEWRRLKLPEITMADATGEHLTLWTDLPAAAASLGLEIKDHGYGPYAELESDEYQVGIVPAEKKETKHA